jgi:hypothetical protein
MAGATGDGGPASAATFDSPHAVVMLPDGGFLIADTLNNRVRRVSRSGVVTTVAGTGDAGFSGDRGPAVLAQLQQPKALAVLPGNRGVLVADALNHRVRLVKIDLRPTLTVRLSAERFTAPGSNPPRISYVLSRQALVTLTVRRRGSVVLRLVKPAAGRVGSFRLTRAAEPGVYALRLDARASDGRTASDRATLVVRR